MMLNEVLHEFTRGMNMAENEERLESLDKEVQVKTKAVEKLIHDLEEEKLGHFEYKKQVEGAIEEILNS